MPNRLIAVPAASLALGLMASLAIGGTAPRQAGEPVQPRAADAAQYDGWRVYQTRCAVCHGPDATGQRNAPNLLERVGSLDAADFSKLVLARYPNGLRSGEIAPEGSDARKAWLADLQRRAEGQLTMPDWANDTQIRARVLDLYAYLRARADGTLDTRPPRRPASAPVNAR